MRRKDLERRSKKYAPVQNVSVVNGYMDAKDFHQKYGTGRVGVKKRMSPAAGSRMINWDQMIELTPIELTALKELAAAGDLAFVEFNRDMRWIRLMTSTMPDYGSGRCDRHHETVDFGLRKIGTKINNQKN